MWMPVRSASRSGRMPRRSRSAKPVPGRGWTYSVHSTASRPTSAAMARGAFKATVRHSSLLTGSGRIPNTGIAGSSLDWPSHNVKLAKSPMANPPPKSQETAQSMTLGSQISMATVVRIREPVSIPDNSNNDTTAAWLRADHTMTVINPIARYMLSIATAKATPIFRQWRMSAGTCLRVQSLNARILADSGTAAHRKPIENTMAAFSNTSHWSSTRPRCTDCRNASFNPSQTINPATYACGPYALIRMMSALISHISSMVNSNGVMVRVNESVLKPDPSLRSTTACVSEVVPTVRLSPPSSIETTNNISAV